MAKLRDRALLVRRVCRLRASFTCEEGCRCLRALASLRAAGGIRPSMKTKIRNKEMFFDDSRDWAIENREIDRFWNNVQLGSETDCWLYTASTNWDGHGRFPLKFKYGRRATVQAHRLSWFLLRGPVPYGKLVCHNCPTGDNPRCVNPNHLFIGTDMDNWRDCQRKGRERHPKHESHGRALLTKDDVRFIRRHYVPRSPHASAVRMAEIFNVSISCIHHIISGKNWPGI